MGIVLLLLLRLASDSAGEPMNGNGPEGPGTSFAVTYDETIIGDYEAKGVGLRSRGSGTITLTAIPPGATVLQAYLYWEIQSNASQPRFEDVTLNGAVVTGALIGSGPGLCWGVPSTFAYRADVTALIAGPGPYLVGAVDSGSTSGGTSPTGPQPLAEGASLVVVWEHLLTGTPQHLRIIDGYVSLLGTSASFVFGAIPELGLGLLGPVRLTVLGGDGQTPSPETTSVNAVVVGANTWDGSDPQTAPAFGIGNLWDTDTFDVTGQYDAAAPTTVTVAATGDCLGPEAFALAVPLA